MTANAQPAQSKLFTTPLFTGFLRSNQSLSSVPARRSTSPQAALYLKQFGCIQYFTVLTLRSTPTQLISSQSVKLPLEYLKTEANWNCENSSISNLITLPTILLQIPSRWHTLHRSIICGLFHKSRSFSAFTRIIWYRTIHFFDWIGLIQEHRQVLVCFTGIYTHVLPVQSLVIHSDSIWFTRLHLSAFHISLVCFTVYTRHITLSSPHKCLSNPFVNKSH